MSEDHAPPTEPVPVDPAAAVDRPATSSDPRAALDELLLDRIDALRVLRARDHEERDRVLEQVAGSGEPERDIVSELAKIRPLWRPDRFEEAHRMAMRSLEVLDRNGARAPRMPRLGPLEPLAEFVVSQIVRWIVKGHQNTLIGRIRRLYERREANAVWGSDEHRMLRRARISAVQVEQGFRGNQLGLPTFLLGGAVLSSIFSALNAFAQWALHGRVGIVVFASVMLIVFMGLSWAATYAAGVARRRIRLSSEQPMKALWETIGACGQPPKDQSYDFAVYAIVLLVVAWLIVPFAVWRFVAAVD